MYPVKLLGGPKVQQVKFLGPTPPPPPPPHRPSMVTACVHCVLCSSALTSEVSQGLVSQAVKAALFNQSRARTPNILRALAQVSAPLSCPNTDAAVGARPLLGDSSPTHEVPTHTTRMDVE